MSKELLEHLNKIIELDKEIQQIQDKQIKRLENSLRFNKSRWELLQKVQIYMRDPERTIVCDILANNSLLPDPKGTRYGQDLRTLIKND
jgi:hypothetical protein